MKRHTNSPATRKAWLVTMTASLFFFYEFFQLIMPGVINDNLMNDFHLDAAGVGWLVSMYLIANTVLLFPAGYMLDRFSVKKIILASTLLCTIGTFIFGYTESVTVAASARFLVGIGAAFCFISCVRIASRWFPPSRMALVTGLIVTMAFLGGATAVTPMVVLSNALGGWRPAIMVDAFFGLLIFAAIFFFVQDKPTQTQTDGHCDKSKLKALGFIKCIKLVILNPNNWLGGVYTSLLNLPIAVLAGLWGSSYLMQVHHLTKMQASYPGSLLLWGAIIASPIFGWFSDHIGRRCLPMIIGSVASLAVILVLMYTPDLSLSSLNILFFTIGFVTSSQVLSYPTIAELNPTMLIGTALSIASSLIMGSGIVFLPLFGYLLEWAGDKSILNGAPIYTAHAYQVALWMLPISFLISIFVAFMIRETYCETQVH